MRRRPGTALACHGCGEGKRQPSQLLLDVMAACKAAAPWAGPVAFEPCLLQDSQHRFDIFFVRYGIAAEADGVQHFKSKMHSKQAAQQYQRDREIDALCWQQGLRLLRFHYADDKQWGQLLLDAIKEVQANPHCRMLWGTRSYQFEAGVQAAAAGSAPTM